MKRIMLMLAALLLAAPALAQDAEKIVKVYAGVNAVSYDGVALPSDLEAGLNTRASLSPHVSLVGSGYYGFDEGYKRAAAGARVTATDVKNPDFSVGLGIQYHVSDDQEVRPKQWMVDTSIGWRPWGASYPNLVLALQGSYGLKIKDASALVGVRYALFSF